MSVEHSQASVGASVENVKVFVQYMISRGQLMNNTGTTLSPPQNPISSLQIPPLDAAGKPNASKDCFDNLCAHHLWEVRAKSFAGFHSAGLSVW